MRTILITAYAINPYKGSEDGTGWNILRQIGKRNRVVLITRENNQEALERYFSEHPEPWYQNLEIHCFDLPRWQRFWKRGSFGALPYYMLWQMALPKFIRRRQLQFDIAHHLNFHNDWLPTHLWRLGKPVVWGPVGHHSPIPAQYLGKVYGRRAWWADRRRHWIKVGARKLNPWYKRAVRKVDRILTISDHVKRMRYLPEEKTTCIPAVGAHEQAAKGCNGDRFQVLSVGRFVPLKGFDLAIRSFADFVGRLSEEQREKVQLSLVGRGPEKERLEEMVKAAECQDCIEFIEWMPQAELMDRYRTASVFLFPSHEGAGMVVPEALSFGLPVVCFDNAGPGELICSDCGVRIPHDTYANTVTAFANALEVLRGKAGLRKKMSQAAQEHIRQTLSWDAKGDAIQAVYNSMN